MQAGLANLIQTVRSTARSKCGLLEAWAASILLLWVIVAIACWSL